jgi:hypothetical protein
MGYGLQYDLPGLFEFLSHTPESALRKMLVDNKPFSEVHFSLMMKMVRNCNVEKFSEHAEKADFPKMRFGPAETALKEKFWNDCFTSLSSRGLLNPAEKKHAA